MAPQHPGSRKIIDIRVDTILVSELRKYLDVTSYGIANTYDENNWEIRRDTVSLRVLKAVAEISEFLGDLSLKKQ